MNEWKVFSRKILPMRTRGTGAGIFFEPRHLQKEANTGSCWRMSLGSSDSCNARPMELGHPIVGTLGCSIHTVRLGPMATELEAMADCECV